MKTSLMLLLIVLNLAAVRSVCAQASSFGMITSTLGNTVGFGTSRHIQFALKYRF
jgi:hypothetical protein